MKTVYAKHCTALIGVPIGFRLALSKAITGQPDIHPHLESNPDDSHGRSMNISLASSLGDSISLTGHPYAFPGGTYTTLRQTLNHHFTRCLHRCHRWYLLPNAAGQMDGWMDFLHSLPCGVYFHPILPSPLARRRYISSLPKMVYLLQLLACDVATKRRTRFRKPCHEALGAFDMALFSLVTGMFSRVAVRRSFALLVRRLAITFEAQRPYASLFLL